MAWSVKNEGFDAILVSRAPFESRERRGESLDLSEPDPASSSVVRRESFRGGAWPAREGRSSLSSISGGRKHVNAPPLEERPDDPERCGERGGVPGDAEAAAGTGDDEGGGDVSLVSESTSIHETVDMSTMSNEISVFFDNLGFLLVNKLAIGCPTSIHTPKEDQYNT